MSLGLKQLPLSAYPSIPPSSSLWSAPTRSPNCTVQPTISRPWLQIVSTGAALPLGYSMPLLPPTPSEPHIFHLPYLLVVTSEIKISVDIHLNYYLEPKCR